MQIFNLSPLEKTITDRFSLRAEKYADLDLAAYIPIANENIVYRLPPRFKKSHITNNEVKKILFEKPFSDRGMYLWGECGTGKTFELYGIYALLGATPGIGFKNLTFTTVPEFISGLKSKIDSENSEREIINVIHDTGILFFDDFGTEKQSEWVEEIIYRLINYRYEQMLPTFFSSNLSLEDLAKRVGDRIVSRIVEMCDIINLIGTDRRLQ